MAPESAFEAFLRSIEDMTYDDLVADVAQLPVEIRERLADGPMQYRYDCGVCVAFGGRSFYGKGIGSADDVRWRVFGYHEVPKLGMKFQRELHNGPHANAMYERCLDTYRAAGWTGEAPPPNA
jgi:hypothetical protein